MPRYLLSYHGGHLADTPEGMAQAMQAFGAWFQELGPALVDRGKPIGATTTVRKGGVSDGGGANPVTGYSVIEAPSLEEAVRMTRSCPVVVAGRSVEIGETFDPM